VRALLFGIGAGTIVFAAVVVFSAIALVFAAVVVFLISPFFC